MKNQNSKLVEFSEYSKQFGESTDLVGGMTAKWKFPTWESLEAVIQPNEEVKPILKFLWNGCLEQVKHHLVSDWMKSDKRLLDDKNATEQEKTEAKLRMSDGYSFNYNKEPRLSSQQGNERAGQRWGKYSKFVPVAKTLVSNELEVDSDEWKAAVIAKCEEIRKAVEVVKKG